MISTLRRFAGMVHESRARGRDCLLSTGFSALDIYLATALAMFSPLPEEQCHGMHPEIRRALEAADPEIRAAGLETLLAYRDLIYRRHLLPVEL